MERLETRARKFDQTIFWRNVREYGASVIVAGVFALIAAHSKTRLEQVGNAIVSAGALWIIGFLWLMQRSKEAPLPESSGEAYKNALLSKYDRQILLLRTAWAWYVLPLSVGLVVSSLGNEHAPVMGYVLAGFMVVFGVAIGMVNWSAAKKVAAEKGELVRMMEGAE